MLFRISVSDVLGISNTSVMWIIEEGREGFRMNGFARIFINSTRFDMYGDCEAVSAYGYQSYTRKFYYGNSASGVVNNKELIKHIKRV